MAVWYSNICFIGGTLIHTTADQGHVAIDQINIGKRTPGVESVEYTGNQSALQYPLGETRPDDGSQQSH